MFLIHSQRLIQRMMFETLLFCHSIMRWMVLLSLLYAIYRAVKGYVSSSLFSKTDNAVRHITATIAHVQLVIGILVYIQSPVVKYFWGNLKEASRTTEILFFGLFHIFAMLVAIILITFGSALAKRKTGDKEKFKTMLIWFSISLLIILLAIPWPFSPFANRPYLR